MTRTPSSSPVRLTGELDPDVGRWHFLFRGCSRSALHRSLLPLDRLRALERRRRRGDRRERPLPEADLRVQRWRPPLDVARRVLLLQRPRHGQMPPFSLAAEPAYAAKSTIQYPERLSRGLVLVKWWLLAIPHYLIVAAVVGAAWTVLDD